MPEQGGATNQAGIYYQNTLAARYLADLLDLSSLPPRERVVEVRLEAPAHVDDIVVRFADGHREWIQAKLSVRRGDEAWQKLWANLWAQSQDASFGADDRLLIIIGEHDSVARQLRDICDRAATAVDVTEWLRRLTVGMREIVAAIERSIGVTTADVLELLRRTLVELAAQDELENTFERRRLGAASALPGRFISDLRDIAGGESRRRATLLAPQLRRRLKEDFGTDITEPSEWGLPAYRAAVERLARIEVPGTGLSGPVSELFVWPRTREYDRTGISDFEDEEPRWSGLEAALPVDLQAFPSEDLDRCVVIAGPGYGKSALLLAIAAQLARSPFVPILVPLGTFSAASVGVSEFLHTQVNSEFDVRVDWRRLAEHGLLVLLFDGLDEIPASERRSVLGKISTYSARYPHVPWLLTVRDPAVLTGPAEARMIELLPLENEDIARFADALRSRVPGLDRWEFSRHLAAYPDLARLARIPLFLTLILAGWKTGDSLPLKRADLIESYLKTLFSPHEHKVTHAAGFTTSAHPPSSLRSVAEIIAYIGVQRQEIGTTEREVREVAARFPDQPGAPDALLERLLTCGVLKRQSTIRLQFPYPIVQEYLAACHLVREAPETLAGRAEDAVQRPWAQVVQFALELHPSPSNIVRQILSREDDAFATALRLVGRCIANGAAVETNIREEIASRLATFWESAPSAIRERVGRLLVDGFSTPLHPSIRSRLGRRWLIYDGAGEIVCRANDPELTLEVVESLMQHDLRRFMPVYPLKPALNRIADQVLTLCADRARQPGITEEQLEGIEDLVSALDPIRLTTDPGVEVARNLALDESLPDSLRLAAFRLLPKPLDHRAWPLVERALGTESRSADWSAMRIIALTEEPEATIMSLVRASDLNSKKRRAIVSSLQILLPKVPQRIAFIERCVREQTLPPPYHDMMIIWAARFGNIAAYRMLLERLPSLDMDLAAKTVSLLGHYRSRAIGVRAAELVGLRSMNAGEVAAMAQSAVLGTTYIYEMDSLDGGSMKDCLPHPSIDAWAELVETWSVRDDLSFLERLRVLRSSVDLGSRRALDRLEQAVLTVTDPDAPEYDDDDYGHYLRSAIDELRRRRRLLPLHAAERFARARKPNVPYAGIAAVGAHADRSAVDLLVRLYSEMNDWHLKSQVMETLETLSGRLGLTLRKHDEKLFVV
jgi:hypothetical protein